MKFEMEDKSMVFYGGVFLSVGKVLEFLEVDAPGIDVFFSEYPELVKSTILITDNKSNETEIYLSPSVVLFFAMYAKPNTALSRQISIFLSRIKKGRDRGERYYKTRRRTMHPFLKAVLKWVFYEYSQDGPARTDKTDGQKINQEEVNHQENQKNPGPGSNLPNVRTATTKASSDNL